MTGGIIILVGKNKQDLILTYNPQISFFKMVYRRYTHFSTETIPQNFIHTPNFGNRISVVLGKSGDLLRKIYFVAEIPRIPMFKTSDGNIDSVTKFAWVRKLGFALIKTVEIEINGELIDRHYGDWLNIWNQLTTKKTMSVDKMIGNIKQITDFTNGKKSFKIYIPLQFWFNRVSGLALPLVSLSYNDVKINIELNDISKLYTIAPTHYINIDDDIVNFEYMEFIKQNNPQTNSTFPLGRFIGYDIINKRLYYWRLSGPLFSGIQINGGSDLTKEQQLNLLYSLDDDGIEYINDNYNIVGLTSGFKAMPSVNAVSSTHVNNSINFNNIKLKNAFLLVEYVFIDMDERIELTKNKLEYLIEQLLYNGEKTVQGLQQSYNLGFIHPCKEYYWVSQLQTAKNDYINDHFNYTNSLIRDKITDEQIGTNIIKSQTILFNGEERLSMRNSNYFSDIQLYQHHANSPDSVINTYSFSLHPTFHQPSGNINNSLIDNSELRINVEQNINFSNQALLRVYTVVYNILRVTNGISGLLFTNNFQNI